MPKITPFLWFDNQAEEAMSFYVSIFKNSKVVSVTRNVEGGPGPKMLQDKDPAKVGRVVKALMPMKRIDIGKLKEAYEGRA